MKAKTILFDADGVVLKGELLTVKLEQEYGITVETTKDFFTETFNRCLVGKADLKEEIKPQLTNWNWKGNVDDLFDYWFKSCTSINQPLIDYIQAVRHNGTNCYLATNQEKYRVNYLKTQLQFSELFDGIFSSYDLEVMKPNPEYYQRILNQLGVDPESVMFWDDSEKNVISAANMGISSHLFTRFEEFKNIVDTWLRE